MATSEQVTSYSVKDLVDDAVVLCGNRDGDAERQRVFIWVKHAITTMANIHHFTRQKVFEGMIGADDECQYVPIPVETIGITSAYYVDPENTLNTGELSEGTVHDLGEYASATEGAPEKFIRVDRKLWVVPKPDKPYKLVISTILGPPIITSEDEEFPLDRSLAPSVVALATSLFLVSIGETEAAGTLRNFAQMMGSTKYGPQAQDNTKTKHRAVVRML